MTAPQKGCPFRGGGPQGLRRPRFSFFRFTCQTAREPHGPHFPANWKADGPNLAMLCGAPLRLQVPKERRRIVAQVRHAGG